MQRPELINSFLSLFDQPRYLEIGVEKGLTFKEIKADWRVGVDPQPKFEDETFLGEDFQMFRMPSDKYFTDEVEVGKPFDVAFIDGLHTAEQTLRDFINVMSFTKNEAVIIIDDIRPANWVEALHLDLWVKVVPMTDGTYTGWTGDVFKLLYLIETFFPSVEMRISAEAPNQVICWKRTKSRPLGKPFASRLDEIAAAQFPQFLLSKQNFASTSLASIIADYKQSRAEWAASGR
ncbi:class I SAM-dependent methyltransferase [Methylorubrum sp. SB2]|uniref:class I SAM-dependent methyltransferase n=1 Tax=Methylorubrum subtropicum TaxID=3138812 RepID=UPI00313CE3FE